MAAEKKQSGRPIHIFVALGCLLVMIVGSSIFFVANTQGSQSDTHRRPQPRASSTPASPTPRATPSPQLTPYTLFSDTFIDNKNGWPTGDASGYTRTIDENGLTLAASNHKPLVESLPTNIHFSDFILTATFTLQQASSRDRVGLYLRGDSNLDHDYRIDIYGDRYFTISKEDLDEENKPLTTILAGPHYAAALHPIGEENTLRVIMKSNTLILMVNDTVVETVTDADYGQGQIALFVENSETSDAVQATFKEIRVDPVPRQWSDYAR